MPRKWTNPGSGGYGKHVWTPPTPFHIPLDLHVVDEILAMNKRLADIEKRAMRKGKRKKQ
jgi:heme exporter protein D